MEANQKLSKLFKESNVMTIQAKKVPKLEAEVEALKHSLTLQRSVHQTEAEGLCVAHKREVE